ncbi:kinase-like domain-containing protein [Cercophora scortea]|uniref:Kinase-like domain-containing protein n=1 Tax=Cercophora scortea TaxID=314031 RepID=A0AAE0J5F0_9PEZI|nr:kinase-like domain-containing protein [Cercophora scortea]
MDDENVVAYIYPAIGTEGYSSAAREIGNSEADVGFVPPALLRPESCGPSDGLSRREREPTVDAEAYSGLEYEACIKVTFDRVPKTRCGLTVGRGDGVELRFAEGAGMSSYHFALTFDDSYRLIVRDLGSTYGTTVMYDLKERGRRTNFDWIVGGSDFLEGMEIIVKVSSRLQFQLVIPQHDIESKSYREKVDRFRAGTADAEGLLDLSHIDLQSRLKTETPSGVQTPFAQPANDLTLKREIGAGAFAAVYRVMNVSTGEQYALKKPKRGTAPVNAAAWEREALIMERINHHIVPLLGSRPGPAPRLRLKYIPGGSIGDHLSGGRHFSDFECKQITAQTTDGLAYLHTLEPQIVHRDIKPHNILIEYRRPDAIFVMFADFGLSREGDLLETFCGTQLYLAPEVYQAAAVASAEMTPYTALVDIWSLGVVVTELVCGLPRYEKEQRMGVGWCHSVRQRAEKMCRDQPDDLLSFVLESMICLEPNARKPATDCHKEALLLLGRARESNDEQNNSRIGSSRCSDNLESLEAPTLPPPRQA